MAITFDDLVAPVTDLGSDFEAAISPWKWLIAKDARPLLITALGDMFIQTESGVYFLNTFEGRLDHIADSVAGWKREMGIAERIDEWFLPGFIEALQQSGRKLKAGEVYSPTIPPILGGPISVENFTPSPWQMHLNVLGQICEQVRDLPPGTLIDKIKVDPL